MNIAPVTPNPPTSEALQYWAIMEWLYQQRMKRLRVFMVIVLLSCLALFLLSMLDPSGGSVNVTKFLPAVAGIQ